MRHRGPIARSFAIMLAVAVTFVYVPQTSAADKATLSGTILAADGEAVVHGAVLHAGDLRTGEIYSSTQTGPDGSFEISDLPPAAYELAIEREGGLYIAGSAVELAPGEQRTVHLALDDEDDDDGPGAAPDPESAVMGKKSIWDKPALATLFVVGGAFVLGAIVSELDDSSDGLASPFQMN